MGHYITALIGTALLLAAGCINPPPPSSGVPDDLEIRYGSGACHAEWGRTNIIIDAKGNGIYESGSGPLDENGRFQNEEFRKTFRLDENELLGLLNGIEGSGFYSLNDYYSDMGIIDGSCNSISVTKNNSTKTVSVSNTDSPAAYSKVAELISGTAENKTK
jgi:hypothetical protein